MSLKDPERSTVGAQNGGLVPTTACVVLELELGAEINTGSVEILGTV